MNKNNRQQYWEVKDFLTKKPLNESSNKPNLKKSIVEILSATKPVGQNNLNEINKKIINSSNDVKNKTTNLLNSYTDQIKKQTPNSKGSAKNIVSNLFNVNEATLSPKTGPRQRAMDKFSMSLQQQNLNVGPIDQSSLTGLNIDPFAAKKSQTIIPGIGTSTSPSPSSTMIASPTSSSLAATSSNVSTPSISPPPPSSMSGKSPTITPSVIPSGLTATSPGSTITPAISLGWELDSLVSNYKNPNKYNKNVGVNTRLSPRKEANVLYGHSRVFKPY